jgi:hypothetical protein
MESIGLPTSERAGEGSFAAPLDFDGGLCVATCYPQVILDKWNTYMYTNP